MRITKGPGTTFIVAVLFVAMLSQTSAAARQLEKQEQLSFFPDYAWLSPDGTSWIAPVHGWDYRSEPDAKRRARRTRALAATLRLTKEESATADFERRARRFVVQNQSGRQSQVRIAGKWIPLKKTRGDGHLHDQIKMARNPAEKAENGWINVRTDVTDTRGDVVTIPVRRLGSEGVIVVSEVDDTLKVTGIGHRRDVLLNTFAKPDQSVEGMNKLFQQWAAEDKRTVFFYVSASPWPLAQDLAGFLKSAGFPRGLEKLKHFRWQDESFASLRQNPEKFVTPLIEDLAQRFPQRCFVLVGDSGEKDPEIFGAFARRHPDRTIDIYIREMADNPESRYGKAFAKIDHVHWHVFRSVHDLGVP